jgi:hypothetical protein
VLVLDSAPSELVRLVGYLESITDHLVIDLVTIASYEINGRQVIVPQRVEPERMASEPTVRSPTRSAVGCEVEGAQDFAAAITEAQPAEQPQLRLLLEWAVSVERSGLARLTTYIGVADRLTLLPRIPAEGVGLVTIWNDHGQAYVQFWRSVLERRAPQALVQLEMMLAPARFGQGTTTKLVNESLLATLTQAYQEAVAAQA